jgi:thiosulfate reductase cytochrome b subunit
MNKVVLYTHFERFWHWTQMILVSILIVTGFEVHGNFVLLGFEQAVRLHSSSAWFLMGLTAITIIWMLSAGHWKNFIPTFHMFKEQIKYYMSGIFKNEPHPVEKSTQNKFNPVQRLVYLWLLILAFPAQIVTGLLYMYFRDPSNPLNESGFELIAVIHTVMAFLLVGFLIIHVYMITTGKSTSTNLKEMITGYSHEESTKK